MLLANDIRGLYFSHRGRCCHEQLETRHHTCAPSPFSRIHLLQVMIVMTVFESFKHFSYLSLKCKSVNYCLVVVSVFTLQDSSHTSRSVCDSINLNFCIFFFYQVRVPFVQYKLVSPHQTASFRQNPRPLLLVLLPLVIYPVSSKPNCKRNLYTSF